MFILYGLVILPVWGLAQVIPTAPGPGQTFRAGEPCSIQWQPDSTGDWKSVTVSLMSGSNNNMTSVTNVVSGLNGASSSSYTWTCPEVHPYSSIYFYQFSQDDANASPTWTTRFTIASPDGITTPPEHTIQPNGDAIPWGNGQLSPDDSEDSEQANTSASSATATASTPTTTSTDRAVSSAVETSAPSLPTLPAPEVTLNLPTPKAPRKVRRTEVYGAEFSPNGLSRRSTSPKRLCKRRRRNMYHRV